MTIRSVMADRDAMLRAIIDAPADAAIVVAVMSEHTGVLRMSGGLSEKDQAYIGSVITHDALRVAFGDSDGGQHD